MKSTATKFEKKSANVTHTFSIVPACLSEWWTGSDLYFASGVLNCGTSPGSFSQFNVGSLFSYTHVKSHSPPCLFVVSMRRISHLIYIFDMAFKSLFQCIHVLNQDTSTP